MKKFIRMLSNLVLLLLLLLLGVITVPKLFQIQPLTVLSGSMEPAYRIGSLVYVQKTDVNEIQIGDTITFQLTDDLKVTHRVVSKNEEAQTFTTKGDANEEEDTSPVPFSKVVGKVIYSIPYLGYTANFLSTRMGYLILIAAIVVLIIISFITDFRKKDMKEGGGKNESFHKDKYES